MRKLFLVVPVLLTGCGLFGNDPEPPKTGPIPLTKAETKRIRQLDGQRRKLLEDLTKMSNDYKVEVAKIEAAVKELQKTHRTETCQLSYARKDQPEEFVWVGCKAEPAPATTTAPTPAPAPADDKKKK